MNADGPRYGRRELRESARINCARSLTGFGAWFSVRVYPRPSAVFALFLLLVSVLNSAAIELTIDFSKPGEPIDLTPYALGQGGLSDKPVFDPHVEQIAQLHPQTIRIFVQEFFDLYPNGVAIIGKRSIRHAESAIGKRVKDAVGSGGNEEQNKHFPQLP